MSVQRPAETAAAPPRFVENRQVLLDHGDAALRADALDILEHGLAAADPYLAIKDQVRLEGHRLTIRGVPFDLRALDRVLFLGAGKASLPIAQALEEILGDRLAAGVVVCKHGQTGALTRIRAYHAAHPIPDKAGLKAAEAVANFAASAGPRDLVLCGITGGSSALLPMPVPEISLADKQAMTDLLLKSGANIVEINAVRKHLSQIKGGWLADRIDARAHVVNLTVSDVIGDPLDYITDPTVPDTSTVADARACFAKYGLWDLAPKPVAAYLAKGGPARETPKALKHHHLYNVIIVRQRAACDGAQRRAEALGYATQILSTSFEGESRELGRAFGAIATEILAGPGEAAAPAAFIGGGETTVTIAGAAGAGGPNQEFALSAAIAAGEMGGVVIAGLDTDGSDGPTDLAGGLCDRATLAAAQSRGIDIDRMLRDHDAATALKALGDGIVTGPTGTNVNDLKLMLVRPPR